MTTDGQHTITYYAVDNAGNKSDTVTKTLRIDTTAPVTTTGGLQVDDQSGWLDTTPQAVTLTSVDGGSGVVGGKAATYYRIDSSGDYSTYTGTLSITTAGSHKVDYYSVDAAGNAEPSRTGYVNIDTQAPATTATTDPSGWTNGSVQVTLDATDAGGSKAVATFFQIGAQDPQSYSGPFTVDDATQITYWSTDGAGNSETPLTLTPQIDKLAPVVTDDIASGWQTAAQTVDLSTTDPGGSGVAQLVCTLDGNAVTLPVAGGSFQVTTDGQHTITYYAVDNAGNKSDTVTKTLRIDTRRRSPRSSPIPTAGPRARSQVTLSRQPTPPRASPRPTTRSAPTRPRPTARPSPSTMPLRSPTGRPISPATRKTPPASRRRSTSWRPTPSRAPRPPAGPTARSR